MNAKPTGSLTAQAKPVVDPALVAPATATAELPEVLIELGHLMNRYDLPAPEYVTVSPTPFVDVTPCCSADVDAWAAQLTDSWVSSRVVGEDTDDPFWSYGAYGTVAGCRVAVTLYLHIPAGLPEQGAQS